MKLSELRAALDVLESLKTLDADDDVLVLIRNSDGVLTALKIGGVMAPNVVSFNPDTDIAKEPARLAFISAGGKFRFADAR